MARILTSHDGADDDKCEVAPLQRRHGSDSDIASLPLQDDLCNILIVDSFDSAHRRGSMCW
jgi:hypothetical protein